MIPCNPGSLPSLKARKRIREQERKIHGSNSKCVTEMEPRAAASDGDDDSGTRNLRLRERIRNFMVEGIGKHLFVFRKKP